MQSLGGAPRLPWQHRAYSDCSQDGRGAHTPPLPPLPTYPAPPAACLPTAIQSAIQMHHTCYLDKPQFTRVGRYSGYSWGRAQGSCIASGCLWGAGPAITCWWLSLVCLRVSLGTILGIPSNATTKLGEAGAGATMGRHEGSSGASPLCLPLCDTPLVLA